MTVPFFARLLLSSNPHKEIIEGCGYAIIFVLKPVLYVISTIALFFFVRMFTMYCEHVHKGNVLFGKMESPI